MKKIFVLALLILSYFYVFSQDVIEDFPEVKGRYFGQKAPKAVPEIFAPGIISKEENSYGSSSFNLKGTMFIFKCVDSQNSEIIYITELVKGIWTKPVRAPFDSDFPDDDFTFSPDEKQLFLSSRRPENTNGEKLKESNIWVVGYRNGSWDTPYMLEDPVNSKNHESYASVAKNGNLYFFCRERGGFGKSDLYISTLECGRYSTFINLGATFNTKEEEWDPFIAPDESYLIFCSTKEGGYGKDDLYISFRRKDRSWTEPVNMGEEFNSSGSENRPYITLDGKYLFFTSTKTGKRKIYWVNAVVLDRFKPRDILDDF